MTFEIFWMWPIAAAMLVLTLGMITVMQWQLLRDNRQQLARAKRQLTTARKELTRLAVTDPHLSLGGLRAEHDPPTEPGQAPPRLGFVMGPDQGSAARWPKPWASMPRPLVPQAVMDYASAQTGSGVADTQVLAPVPTAPPAPDPKRERDDHDDPPTTPPTSGGGDAAQPRYEWPEPSWTRTAGTAVHQAVSRAWRRLGDLIAPADAGPGRHRTVPR